MQRLNRDVYAAIFLLVVCGVFFWASFDIRQPDYGVLPPSTWPRIIIAVLALLSGIYLLQSLRQGPDAPSEDEEEDEPAPASLLAWFSYWRNVFWCFILFFLYLYALPYAGMLVAGTGFVFLLLCALGGWSIRKAVLHAAIALLAVGGMWCLFTYGLGVPLPRGDLSWPF